MSLDLSPRFVLVIHGIVGCALVAAATHLVAWGWPKKGVYFRRLKASRLFSRITCALFATTFVLGSCIYPTYRVEVREAYLDNPLRISAEAAGRVKAINEINAAYQAPPIEAPDPVTPITDAMQIIRWFDIKEHWVALGLIISIALAIFMAGAGSDWHPRQRKIAFALAVTQMLAVWAGAIIGFVVTSYQSV